MVQHRNSEQTPGALDKLAKTEPGDCADSMKELMESKARLLSINEELRQAKEQSDLLNRQLDKELRQMNQLAIQAEAANVAKNLFLTNMSHELRTPMNAVIGFTDLTLASELTPEQRRYLEIVKRRAFDLLNLLQDVLDLSKMEAGKLELAPQEFGLRETMAGCVETLSIRAKEKGIALRWAVAADLPDMLIGDPIRIRQVVLNLLNNALKFTEHGFVELGVQQDGVGNDTDIPLHIHVRDTGIGVPPGRQESIFEPFVQGDGPQPRLQGSVGLGLTICQKFTKMMDGRIWVESPAPDGDCEGGRPGSVFHFTARLKCATHSPLAPAKTPVARALAAQGLRVLLVEDDPSSSQLVTELLTTRGHAIRVATTGNEALEALCKEAFDVALMDIRLGDMDGLEVTRKIRAHEISIRAHLPIVALTAHAMAGDRKRCLDAGVDHYLSKPIQGDELLNLLEQYRGRK